MASRVLRPFVRGKKQNQSQYNQGDNDQVWPDMKIHGATCNRGCEPHRQYQTDEASEFSHCIHPKNEQTPAYRRGRSESMAISARSRNRQQRFQRSIGRNRSRSDPSPFPRISTHDRDNNLDGVPDSTPIRPSAVAETAVEPWVRSSSGDAPRNTVREPCRWLVRGPPCTGV